jgi:hypothetical protein
MPKRRVRNRTVTVIAIVSATVFIALGATGASATAAAVPEPVPAPAVAPAAAAAGSGVPEYGLLAANWETDPGYFLYAHAHNYPVETSSLGYEYQAWTFYRCENVGDLSGQQATACEIQLATTGECLNDVPAENLDTVYLDSCVAGDMNEYFWPVLDGTSGSSPGDGSPYVYINVQASGNTGNYEFLTAERFLGPDGVLVEDTPWNPDADSPWQMWEQYCALNC